MSAVRVVAVAAMRWARNPISGHSWPEYGRVTGYEVRGPLGRISTHRCERRAESAMREWEAFYAAHPIQ